MMFVHMFGIRQVGNRSMRMNNNDLSWGLGTLVWTTQVHNYAPRLYQCHSNAADRQALFEPYVQDIQWLCRPGRDV